jgi:acetyltransferase-like isoleucine patch superfamily enzyme
MDNSVISKCNIYNKNGFFINPKRIKKKMGACNRFIFFLRYPFIKFGTWLGFVNIEYSYVHGNKNRLKIGDKCSTTNTIFNVNSGNITIKENTIFGHNCMLLTGTHQFYNGKIATLSRGHDVQETPLTGRDILIGSGCFIGSGAIIIGPVTIGNNVIIGSGSVITKDIEDSCFVAGVPGVIISKY